MACGGAANTVYALEFLEAKAGNDMFGPAERLMLLLLADECSPGAARLDLERLAARCGVSLHQAAQSLELLKREAIIETRWLADGVTAVWFPIATPGEIKAALEWMMEVPR